MNLNKQFYNREEILNKENFPLFLVIISKSCRNRYSLGLGIVCARRDDDVDQRMNANDSLPYDLFYVSRQ